MNRLLHVALTIGVVSIVVLAAPRLAAAIALQARVMSEYRGVRLGLAKDAVRAAMGEPQNVTDTSEDFKLTGDDTMTVHYDNGQVKAIQLAFLDAKNAPAWKDVVGDAEINEMANGAKSARKMMDAEKFWVTMYQNKEATVTRVTISR
jgi:hypothetical protein